MRCIRNECKNEAINHSTYGILPCKKHQQSDARIPKRKFEFASVRKLHRVQEQRDNHGADLLQPYEGNKPNVDFFKNYPDKVDDYGVRAELEKV